MTATLDQIHADPTIIDRAISLSEPLDILVAGIVRATLLPAKNASTAEAADFDAWLAASISRARGKKTTGEILADTRDGVDAARETMRQMFQQQDRQFSRGQHFIE